MFSNIMGVLSDFADELEQSSHRLLLETKVKSGWSNYSRLVSPIEKSEQLDQLEALYRELDTMPYPDRYDYKAQLKKVNSEQEKQDELRQSYNVAYHSNGKLQLISPLRDGQPNGTITFTDAEDSYLRLSTPILSHRLIEAALETFRLAISSRLWSAYFLYFCLDI